eukprot:scaffold77959_cov64-Phaeocystis_antarctica.AAC.13
MISCELTSPKAARTKTYHAKFQCHAKKIQRGDTRPKIAAEAMTWMMTAMTSASYEAKLHTTFGSASFTQPPQVALRPGRPSLPDAISSAYSFPDSSASVEPSNLISR